MGADQFYTTAKGRNAKEAFQTAHEHACYEYGNRGYTGSLAEKSSFVEINVPRGKNPSQFANELMDNQDDRIRDKWGPAGCVRLSTEPVKRTELVPQKSTTAKTSNKIHNGARKWVTYHVLYADGKEIGKFLKKADALKKGKEYAVNKQIKVTMKLEKRLDGSNPVEAEITPVIPKPKEKQITEKVHTYAFFGWASS